MNPQRALDAPRAFVQYDQAGKFLTLSHVLTDASYPHLTLKS